MLKSLIQCLFLLLFFGIFLFFCYFCAISQHIPQVIMATEKEEKSVFIGSQGLETPGKHGKNPCGPILQTKRHRDVMGFALQAWETQSRESDPCVGLGAQAPCCAAGCLIPERGGTCWHLHQHPWEELGTLCLSPAFTLGLVILSFSCPANIY